MSKEKIINQSGIFLDQNYTCAQSVFMALKENYKNLNDIDESIFAGFGGGFACKGKVCGAIVTATAIISLYKLDKNDPKNRRQLYEILNNLYAKIEKKFGGMNCLDIVKINFNKAEEAKRYKTEKHEQVCKPLVKYITEEIINIIS